MIKSFTAGSALIAFFLAIAPAATREGAGVPGSPSATTVGSCAAYSGLPSEEGETTRMTFIAGGTFAMGSDRHQPEERFTHVARVDGFWIDRHEVTNAQFRKFVEATGYVTLAERPVDPKNHPDWPQEMLVPGSVMFVPPKDAKGEDGRWWQYVTGANWRQPRGPGSSIAGKENHPVVQRRGVDVTAKTTGAVPMIQKASRLRIPGRVSFQC